MPDPLNPRTLNYRLQLFEMITLPSLQQQENKDFSVIIVVDPELPKKYRDRLDGLTKGMKTVVLHDYSPEVSQNSLQWMKPYIQSQTEYLIITKLDADDGLFQGFTKYIYNYLKGLYDKKVIQPVHFIKCKHVLQWDLLFSKNAPYGYLKPWGRKQTITNSTGLTICTRYPEPDVSIFGIDHQFVGYLFEDTKELNLQEKQIKGAEKLRKTIKEKAKNVNPFWDGEICKNLNYHEISFEEPQMLMTNNFLNDRFIRVFEQPGMREVFDPETSLPGIGFDKKMLAGFIEQNRKSPCLLLRILWSFLIGKNYVKSHTIKKDIKRSIYIIKGFRRL